MNDFNSIILYINVFIISVFFLLFSKLFLNKSILYNRFYVFICLLIPSILAGLRYKVGTDYEAYVLIYNKVNGLSYLEFLQTNNYEIGFFTLEKIAMWTGDVKILFFLSSFITLFFIYLALKQHINIFPITLGYMLYIFTIFPDSLNAVRQQLAIAIVVYSLKYIFDKKLYKFLLFTLLASTFHITALIVLPFYFLFHYSKNRLDTKDKYKTFLRGIMLLCITLFIVSYGYFLDLIVTLSSIDRFGEYSQEIGTGNNRVVVLGFFILLFILSMKNRLIHIDHRNKLYIYFLIVGFILSLASIWNPIISRMASYFDISLIFLVPAIVANLETRLGRYLGGLLVCFYSITYFVFVYYILGHSEIIPYGI